MGERFYQSLETARVRTLGVSRDPTVMSPFAAQTDVVVAIGRADAVDGYPRVQLTPHHGRSIIDPRINAKAIWEDSFGTLFGSRDWKGAIMEEVLIREDASSPYGFRSDGLKDDVGIEKICDASRVMRENGLPTEAIVSISKLSEIYDKKKPIPIAQWKRGVLSNMRRAVVKDGNIPEELKYRYKEFQSYIKDMDFYIVERDLQVAERLCDIGQVSTEEELAYVVAPVFQWANAAIRVGKQGFFADPREVQFDFSKKEDVERYFMVWLPIKMGFYLGKLHSLGLVHRYPHAQNWSAVGTLYDLDSVRGRAVGEVEPTEADYERDFIETGRAIQELWSTGSAGGRIEGNYLARTVFTNWSGAKGDENPKTVLTVCAATCADAFIRSYKEARVHFGLKPLRDIVDFLRDLR